MTRTHSLVPWLLAILIAGLIAGCSSGDNGGDGGHEPTPATQYQQTFSGAFASSAETGAITFTVTRTTPWTSVGRRLLGPSAQTDLSVVTGTLTFDGATSQPVTGTYDADADTIYLTSGGYEMSGRYFPAARPPHITGGVTGAHEGYFNCVTGSDASIAIYRGDWGHPGEAAIGRFGFVTKDTLLVGAMILPNPEWPYRGYAFVGTIGSGNPLRPIGAAGRGLLDSLAVGGYADTSADTAGGWWDSIPLIDEIGDGWWHAERLLLPTPAASNAMR